MTGEGGMLLNDGTALHKDCRRLRERGHAGLVPKFPTITGAGLARPAPENKLWRTDVVFIAPQMPTRQGR